MLRSAKEILKYLRDRDIPMSRQTLWTLSRARGDKRFPMQHATLRFRVQVRAVVGDVDDWIERNRHRATKRTPLTPSSRGPELSPPLQ
jgi:hypothetical protein